MENLSPEESLKVIQTMIDKTKTSVADKSFYFLLWGWLVLIGALLQYFLYVIIQTPRHGAAWCIMFVGVIVSVIRGAKEKSTPVKTYVDEGLTNIWICLFVVQTLIVFVFAKTGGWAYCYTAFILLYSIGCFLTGRLLKFPPLVWGAIACWGLAVLTMFVDVQTNMLMMAAAILISYIIPGHLLRTGYKEQLQKQPK
ncbi:MAG TPA: hypothetical protein VHE34_27995 [Puia sp.]|uniref:hypothetical protein n=1 Tax=Puia sp. TaxID=2045100 RepID=UPI002C5323D9|nr:hypothetical protein [Puia sp.]HVU99109.1 hypothetical protein [Puia sp.]